MSKKTNVKISEDGYKLLKELSARKNALREKIMKSLPPSDVRKYVDEKTEQTAKMNGEGFNKECFRLGMLAMWQHLYYTKMLNIDQKDERTASQQKSNQGEGV